jgi:hypothetical protein
MPMPRVLCVLAPCAVPAVAGAAASSGTPRSSTLATAVPAGAEARP